MLQPPHMLSAHTFIRLKQVSTGESAELQVKMTAD
jgi:hypothetical protein